MRDSDHRLCPEGDVEAFPPYAQYQLKTDRRIPVFIATKRS
jgi:hypothetical protein